MLEELMVEARMADRTREHAAAALQRTLQELYGLCRCAPRTREPACELHAADPGLFRRLVWNGLGA